jgi:hypothetical protein|eukprot:COSAG06_NODE_10438_length_1681_cov_0.829962_1_plen_71_part_00
MMPERSAITTALAASFVIGSCGATVHDFDWTTDPVATGQTASPYCTTPCTADPRYVSPLEVAVGDSVRFK